MLSPSLERRARLIREMAMELNSTRRSMQSDLDFPDITDSNLTVEEESSEAYRDGSQHLPTLPETKINTRHSRRPSGDYLIDTSAIGRAFPDMNDSTGSIDDGKSISIELGRGLRGGMHNLSDAGSTSLGPMPGQYKVDLSRLPPRGNRAARSSLREVQNADDRVLRSSPPTLKATNYGTSGSSRHSSGEQAKVPFQATVEDGSDRTASSSGANSVQNSTLRSSRFGRGLTKSEAMIPKRFTSGRDLLREVHQSTARANSSHKMSKPIVENPTVTSTNGGTVQSFMLPNIPNMSELVSGIYDDGTPVFSRNTAGRFQKSQNPSGIRPIKSLPVPKEEEAIMMSLRLLQEKVQSLEQNKAEAEVTIKELRSQNHALEDARRNSVRPKGYDSGVGSSGGSDAGDEGLTATQRITLDKQRMQSTVRNLQNELSGANRRAAVAEANAVNVATERDSAIEQLGVAFVTQEELKVDNENLKEEKRALEDDNRVLKAEIKKYRAAIETYTHQAEHERTDTKSRITEEGSPQPETRSIDCQVIDVDTPRRPNTRRELSRSDAHQEMPTASDAPKRRKRRVVVEEYTATSDFQGFDDETIERIREASRNLSRNISRNISQVVPPGKAASTQQIEVTSTDTSRRNARARPSSRGTFVKQLQDDLLSVQGPSKQQTQTKDLTHASQVDFLHEHDVTILRRMLEKEHLQRKGRLPLDEAVEGETQASGFRDVTQLTSNSRGMPRKSSMKEGTGRVSVRPEETGHTDIDDEEQTRQSDFASTNRRRRHSETSVASRPRISRQHKATDEMTSAFILPDITMNAHQHHSRHNSDNINNKIAPISAAGDTVPIVPVNLENPHQSQNCTICARISGKCEECAGAAVHDVKAPVPILASERIKDLAMDGEEHTERPSERPAEALARTIKALEDEFAHFGIELTALQQQYSELDPSLQKRKRKALGAQIDGTRAAMDAKADQIYALYDVLEGQRRSGTLDNMTEQELNHTLTSVLGEDADMANLGNLGMPNGIMFRRGQKTSSANVTPAKERAKPISMNMSQQQQQQQQQGNDAAATTAALSNISERSEKEEGSRPGTSAGGAGLKRRKFPWEVSDDEEDEGDDGLSWRGFDDTLDLTRGSHKSNTSSKRRSATFDLGL